MISFVKKDLLTIKKDLKLYLFMVAVMSGLSRLDVSKMAFILTMFSFVAILVVYGYDETSNFIGYSISFPNGKRNYVLGKYLSFLLLISIACLISTIIVFVGKSFGINVSIDNLFNAIILSVPLTFIYASIAMPVLFKFGASKFRYFLFITFFGGRYFLKWISQYVDLTEYIFLLNEPAILVMIGVILLAISCFISLIIVRNKEY